MKQETWSIKQIQDMVIEREDWGKKENIYASDSGKCLRGVYYSLLNEKPTNPIDPMSIRRMEVGEMVERNQIEKLKSLGIYVDPISGGQHRIFNEKYKVSGRLDGLIISPEHCTKEAKKIIEKKIQIYKRLKECHFNFWKGLEKFRKKEINEEEFKKGRNLLTGLEHELHEENHKLNEKLLIPNPKNHLMIVEIKSINEWGFKKLIEQNQPMEEHFNQTLFYLSEYSKIYPEITARILYVQMPYQELAEFKIEMDSKKLKELQNFWGYMNQCIQKKQLPEIPSDVELSTSGKWKLNHKADWCRYHIKCTGDPNWKQKAIDRVIQLNGQKKVEIKKIKL